MNWPFVSRARFQDKIAEIAQLRADIVELKEDHARILDEINFRSTGFHLYSRFERKDDTPITAPTPAVERSGVAGAIDKVGTRSSAIRQFLEAEAMSKANTEQAKELEAIPSKEVMEQLNRAMALGQEKGKAAQA